MNGRFFLDTNIFVYSFDATAPAKVKKSSEMIRRAAETGQGIISFQVVQEFFNVALRRFPKPMSAADAEQYLVTVFWPLLAVHSSPSLYLEGLRILEKYRLSWFDSLIVAAALEGQCGILYSEDLQDGRKIEGVKVENPFK